MAKKGWFVDVGGVPLAWKDENSPPSGAFFFVHPKKIPNGNDPFLGDPYLWDFPLATWVFDTVEQAARDAWSASDAAIAQRIIDLKVILAANIGARSKDGETIDSLNELARIE